jgi:Family of unknown function (DUF6481)
MAIFKVPTFQERAELAQAAKLKALEKLKAKPAIDPAILAERQAARLIREAAEAEARAAKIAAREQAKAEKRAEDERKAAVKAAQPVVDKAAQKALRDARYAMRKMKKR